MIEGCALRVGDFKPSLAFRYFLANLLSMVRPA